MISKMAIIFLILILLGKTMICELVVERTKFGECVAYDIYVANLSETFSDMQQTKPYDNCSAIYLKVCLKNNMILNDLMHYNSLFEAKNQTFLFEILNIRGFHLTSRFNSDQMSTRLQQLDYANSHN